MRRDVEIRLKPFSKGSTELAVTRAQLQYSSILKFLANHCLVRLRPIDALMPHGNFRTTENRVNACRREAYQGPSQPAAKSS
ncbi:MAG: hypothetical protein DMF71_12685 [Acidobacteria bacterium]|nr:MAG: hypothetical protein DMF71_12685 [Acidobacteriota bacterium]